VEMVRLFSPVNIIVTNFLCATNETLHSEHEIICVQCSVKNCFWSLLTTEDFHTFSALEIIN
jgi:hypothetical protein